MFRVVRIRFSVIVSSWNSIVLWIILCVMVCANYCMNCNANMGIHYITEMYDPIKMITISDWSKVGSILMYVYPLLVVFPTATLFYSERASKINIYLRSRYGNKKYYYGSAIAVFLATLFMFSTPFILEVLLVKLTSSPFSTKDPSNIPYFVSISNNESLFLRNVFIHTPFLYALIMSIRLGLISAIFALFNYSFSTNPKIKFKMITMVPLMLFLYALMIFGNRVKTVHINTSYLFVIPAFGPVDISDIRYVVGLMIMILISLVELYFNNKRCYELQR